MKAQLFFTSLLFDMISHVGHQQQAVSNYYIIIMICSFFFLKFWEKLCDISTPRCPLDNDQSATDGFGAKKAQVNFSNLVAVTSTVAAQQLARRAVWRGAAPAAALRQP